jgi:hypothetical protein
MKRFCIKNIQPEIASDRHPMTLSKLYLPDVAYKRVFDAKLAGAYQHCRNPFSFIIVYNARQRDSYGNAIILQKSLQHRWLIVKLRDREVQDLWSQFFQLRRKLIRLSNGNCQNGRTVGLLFIFARSELSLYAHIHRSSLLKNIRQQLPAHLIDRGYRKR